MKSFNSIFLKEILLIRRSGYESLFPIIYLFIIMVFFNISLSYVEKIVMQELIPIMIWISCLLICVFNIENIFKDDYEDGTLEIFLIGHQNLEVTILAKVLSHWLISNIPIILTAPIIALVLGIDSQTTLILFISLIIGTPTLSLIGSIAAALTVSLKKNKILVSIIVLPLYVPILIFGTSAVNNSYFQLSYISELYLLAIIFLIFLLTTPIICAKSLKISLD
ncbi:MAG: heme exporter protein CcmB [Gammaproteobacteria bacterium]|nr:heme exporter protein CcmB [Gammaproteobacteria bacterium]